MKTINQIASRKLWLSMILMSTLLVGCNDNKPSPPVVTHPTVVSVVPLDAETEALKSTNVSATFSEAMDAATINEQSFILMAAGSEISGAVTLNAAGSIATFTPSTDLNYSTEYTATLTAGATSALGGALLSDHTWHFTTEQAADTTAPTIMAHQPVDSASDVAVNANISADFSEALDPATVNLASFMVNDGATEIAGTVSYSNLTATFNPVDDLHANTLYTATLTTGITDLADPANALANNYVWRFTTAEAADVTAPTVNSTTPANNAVAIAINANISADFSETLNPATVTSNSFTLSDGTTLVAGTVNYSGTVATFNPTNALVANTLYTATLTTAITDLTTPANPLAENYVWQFTTAEAVDVTAPTVNTTTPVNDAVAIAINANISADFSEALDPATVNTNSFILSDGVTIVEGTVNYSGITAVFNPTNALLANTLYTATLTTAITDLTKSANPLANNYVWRFTTAEAADVTAPTVNSTTPANAAVAIAINANISADFSETLNPATVTSNSFTLSDGTTLVAGTVNYSGTVATFNPTNALKVNTLYTATLTTDITDFTTPANPLAANYMWQFTTAEAADVTAPTVNATTPVNDAVAIAINANISADFSEALDPATVNTNSFILSDGVTTVEGTVSYSGITAVFNPTNALLANTLYTATLTTAITDLTSSANPLIENYVWRFTTAEVADVTPPTVNSTTPADGAVAIAVNANISADFSEALAPATVNTNSFTLSDGTTAVTGTVSYSGITAVFNPTTDLVANTQYTATLTTAITDLSTANSLANNYVWSFTTALSTPTITLTNPLDEETDVAVNHHVVATFSEPMNAVTIDNLSFTVVAPDLVPIAGVVNLDVNSNTAMFLPASDLLSGTIYTATITTAAMSSAGVPLASDYSWRFTTVPAPDVIAPTVVATNPLDNATGFVINRNIVAEFSEALNPTSVNSNSFVVTDGVNPVVGDVVYNGTTMTLDPTGDLLASTLYTATLTTAITDLAEPANPLATDYIWRFTTDAAIALGPDPVNLRTAGNFVILTKTGVTNIHSSAITGNMGSSPITAAAMDNVFCNEITGTIYGSDAAYTGNADVTCFAGTAPDNTLVANAVLDLGTAYADAAARTTPDFTELFAGDISGQTLIPGLYKWGTGVLISTDVTLNGGANDVWIFQVSGDVTQASGSHIILTGGALSKNVFWQVDGGAGIMIGTGAHFSGVALVAKGITVNTGASVDGRLLVHTAVTLDQNAVTQPAQ